MSTYIEKMRAALDAKSGELDAIIKKAEAESRALTADEAKQIEEIEESIKAIEVSIAAEERREQRKAERAVPGDTLVDDDGQVRSPATPAQKLTQVEKIGLISMAIATKEFLGRAGETKDVLQILDEEGFGDLAKDAERERKRRADVLKTLSASTNVSGGFLTPDNQATDIIELLYPETTFLQGEPRRAPMPNGTYRQPAGASGATAGYRREGGKTATTEPTFREINMSAKFLGAIVPMTRQAIEFTLPGAQQFVEQDLSEAMGQALDAKAYYGDGQQGEPQGLFMHEGITIVPAPASSPTLSQIDDFFSTMRLAHTNNNITGGRKAFVMAPRVLEFLQTRRVGNDDGEYAYPETRGESPRMGNTPILNSTQFPINLDTSGGGHGDETDIGYINFADVLFGVQSDLALATSSEATIEINGELVSAFQNDLVFLRALSAHDIGLRRLQSIALCRGVRWGS